MKRNILASGFRRIFRETWREARRTVNPGETLGRWTKGGGKKYLFA